MKLRRVIIGPRASEDILSIFRHIAQAANTTVATTYVQRLEAYIRGFDIASERGTLRSDIRPNVRVVGFEKRITIAFKVKSDRVEILRCFWGGQNWVDKL